MGAIVRGGRRHALKTNASPGKKKSWVGMHYKAGDRQLEIYGAAAILNMHNNLTAIREHFGINQTDAFKIAVHLVARGIKEGRFNA